VQIRRACRHLIANLAFLVCNATLSNDALLILGLAHSVPCERIARGGRALYPSDTSETPSFRKIKEADAQVKLPIAEVLTPILEAGSARRHRDDVDGHLLVQPDRRFRATYGTQTLGFSRNAMLSIALIACALCIVLLPAFASYPTS